MIRAIVRAIGGAGVLALAIVSSGAGVRGQNPARFGDPLPNLVPADFERFRLGLEDFLEVENAEDGLGPSFNGTSCAMCHNVPAVGGVSLISEVRAAYREKNGEIRPLRDANGVELDTLYHLFSNPTHACQPVIPLEANIIARRIPIPLFGAGLVEAIPDDTLVAIEDPLDRDGDGISGVAARIVDVGTNQPRIGRFGWKAQHATLRTFSGDAYRNEMGITNELFRTELSTGVAAAHISRCDPAADPEDLPDPRTGLAAIDNFDAFMKFLAPPPRGPIDDTVRFGEQVFSAVGCAACHVPALTTGPSSHPAFSRVAVPLFSDLLLHDIGTGDGIPQASAPPNDIRTPALWGLRARRPLLHDGSAGTLEEAIARHRGEADRSRQRFEGLSGSGRPALLAFLGSL